MSESAWPTRAAATERQTLVDVVAALARSPAVEAVVLIGSAAAGLRPESDLDLLVLLGERAPRLDVLVTRVDGRLADVVFARSDELLSLDAPALDEEASKLAHWLATGRVVHDRTGRATALAERLRARRPDTAAPAPADLYGLWFSANFNLLHTRRMLASSDQLYHEAIDVRFLYQLLDLFFGYFRARGLAVRGEKDGLRHLQAHDRPYLDLFLACLHEADRARRVELYEELVGRTVAPIGPLWPPGSTAVTVPEATPGRVEEALRFWDALFDGEEGPG
jgi:predicted nucleotidyltransferase